jgi:oligopeptide transport system substrate-binding protein
MRAVTALVCSLCALLTACGPGGDGRADLVFINGAEPETLDPALITGQPEGRLANALFEGLLRFDENGRHEPGVAESFVTSPDQKTVTFKLRGDARWSDGIPVTANDFVNSWRRALDPATGAAYSYLLFPIRGAEAFSTGAEPDFSKVGIRAPDDRTLVVELENPTPYFPDLCAFTTLLPVRTDVVEKHGDDWIKPGNIVNNGAFLLAEWRINDRVRLRKNPMYWDAENVKLETVDALPISKAGTAFNFYAGGEADLLMDKGLAPPALLDELRTRPDFHAAPFLGTYFLRFNASRAPFDNPLVRRAFAHCVDREAIVRRITRAGELPAAGMVPPGLVGYPPKESSALGLEFEPETARALLAEAGFAGGKGMPPITYLYSEGELNEAIAVELQDTWRRELGVTVRLARQEWKVYLNSLASLDYSIARSSWVGDYPDPTTFLDMFLAGSGNNRTGWNDPAYDTLLARAAKESDPAQRLALLHEAETMLVNIAAPVCPVYYYVGIQFYNPERVGGVRGNILDEHPIRVIYRKDRPSSPQKPAPSTQPSPH